MSRIYTAFTGITKKLPDLLYEKKKEIMYRTMFGDIDTLGQYLDRISEKDRDTRDFTRHSLTVAIVEVMACFPIYRTYVTESGVNRHDRRYIEQAVAKAKRRNRSIDRSAFDFLRDVLILRNPAKMTDADKHERIDFAMRFQQLTGPVMAKAVEDTSYYLYNRLISLNEVGGNPEKLGISLEAFHGQNMERVKSFPYAMIATSTHDSKRSEDVRARINVISEMAEEWGRHVVFWSKVNKRSKFRIDQRRVPEPNEEYLLYQTLVGTWPMNFEKEPEAEFKSRIKGYMIKMLREAKVNSSWIVPNIAYEEACLIFIDSILNREGENAFLEDFEPFQKKVSHYGMLNSLSQTLLKIGSPGVPDFYQGTDIWDFSLVDPDNRRPVDYEVRQRLLRQIKKAETEKGATQLCRELSMSMEDGRIKLYVISKALKCRRLNRTVFEDGRYVPLEVTGLGKNNVVAFLRASGRQTLCVVVPRLLSMIVGEGRLPFGSVWKDTFVIIPSHKPLRYRNIYTEEVLSTVDRSGATGIPLSELLSDFPVALLTPVD
jgi:(1->4)-alpha-D-glucan 1-alpha-D-glucosylmutase